MARSATRTCPLLRPGRASRPDVAVYCALPGGGVRLPERDELRRFCLTGRWEECLALRGFHGPNGIDLGIR